VQGWRTPAAPGWRGGLSHVHLRVFDELRGRAHPITRMKHRGVKQLGLQAGWYCPRSGTARILPPMWRWLLCASLCALFVAVQGHVIRSRTRVAEMRLGHGDAGTSGRHRRGTTDRLGRGTTRAVAERPDLSACPMAPTDGRVMIARVGLAPVRPASRLAPGARPPLVLRI
jgi:hypothetical protein